MLKRVSLLFLFFLLAAVSGADGQDDAPTPTAISTKAEQVDALLTQYHEYDLFNGAVLVAEEGEVIYKEGFGYADMAWDVPNTTDTKFRIASLTKQFTATLILQLMEEGKIDLHAAISEYLPDYPKPQGERITIHHLLIHTSGIPSIAGIPNFWRGIGRRTFAPDSFATVIADLDLKFDPGTGWTYSSPGYFLLGVIIEHVTGKPYDEVLEARILEPFGLDDTVYEHTREIIEQRAHTYVKTSDGYRRALYFDPSTIYASGMVVSTVEDLFQWSQALYRGEVFQQPETKTLMFKSHVATPMDPSVLVFPVPADYGYGWSIQEAIIGEDTVKVIQHQGNMPGVRAWFGRMPEQRRTVIVLDNTHTSKLTDISRGVTHILYGLPAPAPKHPISAQ